MTTALSPTVKLAIDLIKKESLTPCDAGCMKLLADLLEPAGFNCQVFSHGKGEREGPVTNFWATHTATNASQTTDKLPRPIFSFIGHTDVVATGPVDQWTHAPFSATIDNETLFGRGAADMKGSVAAMTIAALDYVRANPSHLGTVSLLLTSDEEGPAKFGVASMVKELTDRDSLPDFGIIGEPSSDHKTADQVRVGRRGSLNCWMKVRGRQGHVAYPDRVVNPIHTASVFMHELVDEVWDEGDALFPPTTLQIANFNAGFGDANVVPGEADLHFNLRYSPVHTADALQERIEAMAAKVGVEADFNWVVNARPFYTAAEHPLIKATSEAISEACGYPPNLSTSGGTSDGRFLAPNGVPIVELGPLNSTIHSIDECVQIAELDQLTEIYHKVVVKLLGN